ncbi:MAG: 4Fe-4S binding protein [Oscillospiraceae bacterium]
MAYQISSECIGCGTCAGECPVEAISKKEGVDQFQIDPEKCIECGTCASVCPTGAAHNPN